MTKKLEFKYINVFLKIYITFFSATALPYVIYSAQTQQSKMTTPSDISSPVLCTMAVYPSPQGNVSPRTTDNNLSDQHLSYGDLKDSTT